MLSRISIRELLQTENDTQALQEVFEFYEELATSDDEKVQNLLQVTLLEVLWDEKVILEEAYTHMLPETRKANERIREHISYPSK